MAATASDISLKQRTKFKLWTLAEIQQIRESYKTKTERQIAKEMGLTIYQIGGVVTRYKLKSGRNSSFPKGHTPWNAGKFHRASPQTEFKKGNLPSNTKHDGFISVRRDQSGTPYRFIRVSMGKWIALHRYNWQQVYGPIPKGKILIFKDKDTANCDVSNLELITRAENLQRNHNRKKARESMKALWKRERVRKKYGLSPVTKLGARVKKF